MDKLTEHELFERLNNEFDDVNFSIVPHVNKGVVATVHFYEDKIKENVNAAKEVQETVREDNGGSNADEGGGTEGVRQNG